MTVAGRFPAFVLSTCVWVAAPGLAHPGIGVVQDRRGNVFFTDLHQVWRIAPDGRMAVVVPIERHERTDVVKRSSDGRTKSILASRLVQCMTVRPDGTLFLVDGGALRKIAPDGAVTTVVAALTAQEPPPAAVADLNYCMGLWLDAGGAVHVAVARERLVLKVDAAGRKTVVARSPEPWAPSGGMFDQNGDLWLLEYDPSNAVRVRHIGRDGRERTFEATRARIPGAAR